MRNEYNDANQIPPPSLLKPRYFGTNLATWLRLATARVAPLTSPTSSQISIPHHPLKSTLYDSHNSQTAWTTPRLQIQDVVRSITEPQDTQTVLENVDKYFTEDAFILHPMVNQPQFARGRDNLKAIYYIFRKGSRNNKIHFHAVMFSEDLTQCTLGMQLLLKHRYLPSELEPHSVWCNGTTKAERFLFQNSPRMSSLDL
ncbi:hypothetical protein Pst134EB_004293 [Puccinia striiformis f. sp. tritici]|nr:hypothetical protein Pst134EB_004293 [Puccinia striiformis f. sp. tritici]